MKKILTIITEQIYPFLFSFIYYPKEHINFVIILFPLKWSIKQNQNLNDR